LLGAQKGLCAAIKGLLGGNKGVGRANKGLCGGNKGLRGKGGAEKVDATFSVPMPGGRSRVELVESRRSNTNGIGDPHEPIQCELQVANCLQLVRGDMCADDQMIFTAAATA
jgi:hypothetical protein